MTISLPVRGPFAAAAAAEPRLHWHLRSETIKCRGAAAATTTAAARCSADSLPHSDSNAVTSNDTGSSDNIAAAGVTAGSARTRFNVAAEWLVRLMLLRRRHQLLMMAATAVLHHSHVVVAADHLTVDPDERGN